MSKRLNFKEWLDKSEICINDMIEDPLAILEILEEVYNKGAERIKNLEEENSNLREIIRDTKDLDAGALYDLRYGISLLEEDSFEGWTDEAKKGYLTAITTIKKKIEELY